MATVRGLGGFCYPNPFPGTAYGDFRRELESVLRAKAQSARLLARGFMIQCGGLLRYCGRVAVGGKAADEAG
jgi:hypothetical protein